MGKTFTYDDMNRLTGITLKRPSGQDLQCSVTYDALGRMTSRQAVTSVNGSPQVTTVFSQPVFDATKVHATTHAQSMAELFPSSSQTVAYSGFDKANVVRQGNDSICYTYGHNHQRISMKEVLGGNLRTKDYVGNCEYITETDGSVTDTHRRTYLSSPTGVFAVVVTKSGSDQIFYVLKDNLGSWTAITDGDGSVKQELSYDAWGNLRDPDTWANYLPGANFKQPVFDRGFTGHEHMMVFGLVNMNGRVYDPVTSTFLSVDNYVQDPSSTQSFNRYAYCMNNPLKYTDPDGEWAHLVIGALIGGVVNLATNWNKCEGAWEYVAAFGAGAASGAVSAALPGWGSLIGGAITGATNNVIAQTGKNFTSNGTFNWSQFGINCVAGAAAGIAGYGGGLLGARAANVVIGSLNIVSPVTKGFVGGVLGGGVGGFAGGFAGGLVMSNGNLDVALSSGLSGAFQGASLGGVTGVAGGFHYAKKHDLNPWTGVKKGSVTIGENMSRVLTAQKQLKNGTIKNVWPDDLPRYIRKDARIINPDAMDFNAQWIEFVKEKNAYIYDIGTPNENPVSSPFYNMEQARTMDYLNLIKVKGIDGKIIWYRNGN